MAELIIKTRKTIFASLRNIKSLITNPDRLTSPEAIDVRVQRLDALWCEFQSLESQIIADNLTVESQAVEFEDEFFDVKAGLMKLKKERFTVNPQQKPTDTGLAPLLNEIFQQQRNFLGSLGETTFNLANRTDVKDGIQLPKVTIEKFDGVYKNWPAFEDAYVSSIHNNQSLSNVTKFKLLKRLLEDGPAALIKNILETEANYDEAWNKLITRYRKRKHILMSYITAFMDQLPAVSGHPNDIRSLSDKSDELLIGIRTMGKEAEYRDAWLIQILLRKLDAGTRQEWVKESVNDEFPSITQFLNFLNLKCDGMDEGISEVKQQQPIRACRPPVHSLHAATNPPACLYCKRTGHLLYRCIKFRLLNGNARRTVATQLSVCQNCLKSDHTTSSCTNPYTCRYCNQLHHSLLHEFNSISDNPFKKLVASPTNYHHADAPSQKLQQPQPSVSQSQPSTQTSQLSRSESERQSSQSNTQGVNISHNCLTAINTLKPLLAHEPPITGPRTVILPTALVHVRDRSGNINIAYALLDSGSQCSFVSEQLVQRLGLTRAHSSSIVSGLSNKRATITKGVVSIEVLSRFTHHNRLFINAYILPTVVTLASAETDVLKPEVIKSLRLADPHAGAAREIDLLLGADVFFDIIYSDKIVIDGRTQAQSTMFGWILIAPPKQNFSATQSFSTVIQENNVNETLQRFWEIEEVPAYNPYLQGSDQCELFFQSTVRRENNGRYLVRLPFKTPKIELGHSKSAAVRRLLSMERRFQRDPSLAVAYQDFMKEYLSLHHMELISDIEPSKPDCDTFYLPHHAVFKAESSTTKLRVVFDGSCKTSSGWSLNEALHTGPTIQNDLVTIILRFRKYATVFASDVEKMYRQIRVASPDDDFQRIVWRHNSDEEIKAYRLKTVTYGTSCAPFLAVRTLHQIAIDNKSTDPEIAEVITRDFYIDDLLSGCDDDNTAIPRVKRLLTILGTAGFHLRKWKSNSQNLLKNIPVELRDLSSVQFSDKTSTTRTLGIQWNPMLDVFQFTIELPASFIPTKRQLLSEISRIFDPLGWLSPTTISMKVLFQQMWRLKIEWDDQLPQQTLNQWLLLREKFVMLNEIQIPRYIHLTQTVNEVQLHVFCDASEMAYSAVAYLRVTTATGDIQTSLLIAKTKVAPLKQITLPRLELCGALLATKIMKFVLEVFKDHKLQVFGWTDSEIVLAWLSDEPRRWKTFIANRTSQILRIALRSNWYHVPSHENPADCASRGIDPAKLITHSLWWTGPKWLSQESLYWPKSYNPANISLIPEERRPLPTVLITIVRNGLITYLLNRWSSLTKIIRIVTQLLRFRRRVYGEGVMPYIDVFRKAELVIVKSVQLEVFEPTIRCLKRNRTIDKTNSLASLAPFLDEEGILRVGGRLENLACKYDVKHPIILPKVHRMTELVLREFHLKNLHPGPSLMISLLRQRFWIVDGRNVVRYYIQKCIRCFRFKGLISTQLMGNLPRQRITINRPFTTVGVDFAGPVLLKTTHGRGRSPVTKAYISLFVCFTVKAIHIELVSDMTSDAFIAALRRFIARRGIPNEIISDNGTNFVGAKRELAELCELFENEHSHSNITKFLEHQRITFKFNPASAPHFGGLWESNIKSIKYHLRRVTSDATMTFEEMTTLLCQIESLLNSRPIGPLTSDPENLNFLTPGHFLIGEAPTTLPEPSLIDIPMSRQSRWQNIQQRMQGYWQQWSLTYLHNLQQRPKWQTKLPNLSIGDITLIKEDNMPPSKWLLGKIIQLHPGKDDLVRVATVKTSYGEMKRPIAKLCRLPLNNDDAGKEP